MDKTRGMLPVDFEATKEAKEESFGHADAERVDNWIHEITTNPPDFLRRSLRGDEHDRAAYSKVLRDKAALRDKALLPEEPVEDTGSGLGGRDPKDKVAKLDDSVVTIRRKDGSFNTAVLEGTLNRLVGGQYDIPYTPVVDRVAKLLADKEGLEDKVEELERKLSDLESRSKKAATPRDALDLAMMARAAGIDVDVPTLMEVPTEDLIDELKRRNEVEKAASWIETDDIAVIARDRGIKLLIDGRFEDLEAEMRRVSDPSRPTVEGYYFTKKRDGAAHVTDAPLVTMETFQDLISAEDMAIIKAKRARGIGPAPPLCHPYGTRSKRGASKRKKRRIK